jgi:hypothetical protein
MASSDKNVDIALKFARSIIGSPYVWWKGGESTLGDNGPMWVANSKVPSIDQIMKEGTNCTGLLNLIYRRLGKPIPGVAKGNKLAGGTGAWYRYLKSVAEPFDYKKTYPTGTLLMRKYVNVKDQGHVAIVFEADARCVLFSKLLHSYTSVEYDETTCKDKTTPGIAIDSNVGFSHFWVPDGFYQFAVLPEQWLD